MTIATLAQLLSAPAAAMTVLPPFVRAIRALRRRPSTRPGQTDGDTANT